jgi:rhodanese-related sulfurtransferase
MLAGADAAALLYGLPGLAMLAGVAFLPRVLRRLGRTEPAVGRMAWIDPDGLCRALAKPGTPHVIDVRGKDEYLGPLGHIPSAANIPVDALVAQPRLAGPAGRRPLVLVCLTERRSARAAAALIGAGHRDVAVLRGGMRAWTAAGMPVDHSAPMAGEPPRETPP